MVLNSYDQSINISAIKNEKGNIRKFRFDKFKL